WIFCRDRDARHGSTLLVRDTSGDISRRLLRKRAGRREQHTERCSEQVPSHSTASRLKSRAFRFWTMSEATEIEPCPYLQLMSNTAYAVGRGRKTTFCRVSGDRPKSKSNRSDRATARP